MAFLVVDLFVVPNPHPPCPCPSHILKSFSPSLFNPSLDFEPNPTELLKEEPYDTKMLRGKAPHIRLLLFLVDQCLRFRRLGLFCCLNQTCVHFYERS